MVGSNLDHIEYSLNNPVPNQLFYESLGDLSRAGYLHKETNQFLMIFYIKISAFLIKILNLSLFIYE